jgi:hypothetical protein
LAGIVLPPGRSRRRSLDRIEKALMADDPGLGSLFAIFTRLTLQEAIPGTEQARLRRRPSRLMVIATGLTVVLITLLFITRAPSPRTCGQAPALGQHNSVSCPARH